LGIVDTTRTAVRLDVPTNAETGTLPGYRLDTWLGLAALPGTPKAVIERISTETARPVRDATFVEERLKKQAYDPIGSTPNCMAEVMKTDLAKYAKRIRDARISAV
jgi:tripartite-type tricarboxylate transporter receptor subunit TctC